MVNLLQKKCIPCEGKGINPFTRDEVKDYLAQVSGWTLDKDAKRISKEFKFKDVVEAMKFVERVADIAEREGHHPDIHIHYNKVLLDIWTHAIDGLFENDFILAAKIDAIN